MQWPNVHMECLGSPGSFLKSDKKISSCMEQTEQETHPIRTSHNERKERIRHGAGRSGGTHVVYYISRQHLDSRLGSVKKLV